ncbi:uncharacterized protein AB9W97_009384 [Spinachia spinachia]
MSANSSSAYSFDLYKFLEGCIHSTSCSISIIASTICSLLLVLPPCVYVVYLGLKRRRSGTAASHSDVFTYHMVAIELINFGGFILCSCGVFGGPIELITVSMIIFSINTCGQQLFHTLTCVERYVAVVHPVAYLRLRNQMGATARDVSIGCVWLLCFAYTLIVLWGISSNIVSCCLTLFNFVVVSLCSLSVLCVLIGPRPGERGEGRQQVDRAKKRAFYTITAILGVLLLKFGATVASTGAYFSTMASESDWWNLWLSFSWLSLPSSLVLPLLFLHRAGKLVCCKSVEE